MCGIAGILHRGSCADAGERAARMAAAMRHRGPDGTGTWSDADVALVHTRLAILDLTGGVQPMTNEDGRVVVVYNGEIYNHRELRRELVAGGHHFRSDHSDTEVLVHGYETWGKDLPTRLNGMFAFVLWDARNQCLMLARDRFGIKPLYLAETADGTLLFASEVRAILAAGLIAKRLHAPALLEALSFQNVWGEATPFQDVRCFPAAHVELRAPQRRERTRWWDLRFPRAFRGSQADAAEQHRAILRRVVDRQLDADVPVSTYLSGGIDSSGVTAAIVQNGRHPTAYTCRFDLTGVGDDRAVDEREAARATARHLGLEHVEYEVARDALSSTLEHTITALEYPRMGMSYVNDLIAGRVARDARVVLSGMGGDELHGGYVGRYAALLPARDWRERMRRWARALRRGRLPGRADPIVDLVNGPIGAGALSDALTPAFRAAAGAIDPAARVRDCLADCPSDDPLDRLMYLDARTYLHGLLVLEDKLSMAHSLETRVPLLDHELVDFVLDLPWPLLCDGAIGKRVFRESVAPWLPADVVARPKMGFGPPDASWYRTALRPWIERELSAEVLRRGGVFEPAFVARVLAEHFRGARNHVSLIWTLLSVTTWQRVYAMEGAGVSGQ